MEKRSLPWLFVVFLICEIAFCVFAVTIATTTQLNHLIGALLFAAFNAYSASACWPGKTRKVSNFAVILDLAANLYGLWFFLFKIQIF